MLSVKTGSNHTEYYKENRGKSPKIPPCRGNTSTLQWPSFLIAFCAYVQAYMLYYKWDDSPRGNFYTHPSLLLNYFITLFPTFTFSPHISSYLLIVKGPQDLLQYIDPLQGLTGLTRVKVITAKQCKAKSAKGKCIWGEIQGKPGASFQEFSPNGAVQDTLNFSSNELWQHVPSIIYQGNSLETQCPKSL